MLEIYVHQGHRETPTVSICRPLLAACLPDRGTEPLTTGTELTKIEVPLNEETSIKTNPLVMVYCMSPSVGKGKDYKNYLKLVHIVVDLGKAIKN